MKRRLYVPGGRWRFLCVGRMAQEKGFDVVLRALASLPESDFHVTFIGDGPELPALRTLAASLPVAERASFLGHLPADELADRLPDFDVLVVASHAIPGSNWCETQCCVMQEAMLMGTLVIASRFGGIPESLAPVFHPYLYEPESVPDLADRLSQIMRLDEKAVAELGSAGRDFVHANYDIRNVNADMLGQLEAIVAAKKAEPSRMRRLLSWLAA